ncbi:unnamed protein product [Menidia menidia]|uniref:(Atlantic silverside) hypothetical protein n=1 Tax=Menidia menidia TaxID=238744 RepID=A0A8S4BIB3_9TELE|nr:unnamed protein product [Menidia menidia]
MPKTNKTEKKTTKTQENDEQSGDASGDEANAITRNASLDPQQYALLEGIKTLSQELKEFKNEMKHDIEKLKEDVKATMKEDLSRFREEMMCELQNQKSSITEVQTRVADLEAACLEMKNELLETLEKNKAMNDKLVDLESRSRRNNLRIYGVPEGKEGRSVSEFVTDLLNKQLKLPDGMRTYENAVETASDMIKKGFGLTWVPKENKLRSAKEKLDSLLPWKRIINTDTGQRAREKLTEFRREDQ